MCQYPGCHERDSQIGRFWDGKTGDLRSGASSILTIVDVLRGMKMSGLPKTIDKQLHIKVLLLQISKFEEVKSTKGSAQWMAPEVSWSSSGYCFLEQMSGLTRW